MENGIVEDKRVIADKVSEMLNLDVFIYVGEDNDIWYVQQGTGKSKYYSWTMVGLCMKKAEELGWRLIILVDGLVFFVKGNDGGAWTHGKEFQSGELGHPEAIIRAFREIPIGVNST